MVFDHPMDALRDAAARAKNDPFYLSGLLEAYRQMENLSQEELARQLGCLPDMLPRLALCRRPDQARFRDDIRTIASRFAIRPDRLANLVRAAEAYQASQSRHKDISVGELLAARDRNEVAEPRQPSEGPEEQQE